MKLNHGCWAPSHPGEPLGAVGDAGDAGKRLFRRSRREQVRQLQSDGELGQLLQLVVRAEQLHVHALHHGGDGLVGDVGEHLLAEAEEVQVGDVAEVEELEVVLPVLVGELDQPVVALQQLLGAVLALAGEDVLHRDHVGERLK